MFSASLTMSRSWFQFYYSAIKTGSYDIVRVGETAFQFYYSAIKTKYQFGKPRLYDLFQFYYSAIKTCFFKCAIFSVS